MRSIVSLLTPHYALGKSSSHSPSTVATDYFFAVCLYLKPFEVDLSGLALRSSFDCSNSMDQRYSMNYHSCCLLHPFVPFKLDYC